MTDKDYVRQTYPNAAHTSRIKFAKSKGDDGFYHSQRVTVHEIIASPHLRSQKIGGPATSEALAWTSAARRLRRAPKVKAPTRREAVITSEDQDLTPKGL